MYMYLGLGPVCITHPFSPILNVGSGLGLFLSRAKLHVQTQTGIDSGISPFLTKKALLILIMVCSYIRRRLNSDSLQG